MRELSLSGIASRYVSLHARVAQRGPDPQQRGDRDRPTRPARSTSTSSSTRSTGRRARACRTSSWARPLSTRATASWRRRPSPTSTPRSPPAARCSARSTATPASSRTSWSRPATWSPISRSAQRPQRPDPAPLDHHAALAAQRVPWAQSLQQLPGFMRLANTTFVNLRTALNDLTPLVNDSKPVAPKLQKLLVQLRPLAQDSVPTVARPLEHHQPAGGRQRPDRADQARRPPGRGHGPQHQRRRRGRARGRSRSRSQALNGSTPELATARPYAVDLTGWFEGYTHPGRTTPTAASAASRRWSASARSRTGR